MKGTPPKSIDEYLAGLSEKEIKALEKLRKTIKSVAPDAEEVISYHIPTFKLNGALVGFAAFTKHLSFFVMSSTVLHQFSEVLKGYETATGTIRFAADKPLPTALVKKIVEARIKENEAIVLARKNKKELPKKVSTAKETDAEKVDK